jgi:hypothetical protein
MNKHQEIALKNHCRLAAETINPAFRYTIFNGSISIVLTVNSGYE